MKGKPFYERTRKDRPPGAEPAGTSLRGRQCAGTSGAAAAGGAPPSVGGKAQRRKGQIRLGPGAVPGRAAVGAAFHRGRAGCLQAGPQRQQGQRGQTRLPGGVPRVHRLRVPAGLAVSERPAEPGA